MWNTEMARLGDPSRYTGASDDARLVRIAAPAGENRDSEQRSSALQLRLQRARVEFGLATLRDEGAGGASEQRLRAVVVAEVLEAALLQMADSQRSGVWAGRYLPLLFSQRLSAEERARARAYLIEHGYDERLLDFCVERKLDASGCEKLSGAAAALADPEEV